MSRSYTSAIDWLKCLGITLILYGHVAGWAPLAAMPPIYSKQLGVAFFLFASGYSLSAEARPPWRVAFNRLFEIYLFGVPFALLVSLVSVGTGHGLKLSNFLPFLAGANVLFNHFPANPTTWYLGTYTQLVLLWTLVIRRLPITAGVLVGSFAFEIAVRALLMQTAGSFVAYMLLPNWSTVFLLGCWSQRRSARGWPGARHAFTSIRAPAVLVGGAGAWLIVASRVPFERTFPFMRLPVGGALAEALLVSAMVSVIYIVVTDLVFRSVAARPAPRPVRFIARNTLVIFLVHMPLYYAVWPVVADWHPFVRSAVYMVICLPGLAWVSEAIRGVVGPRELRERVAPRFLRVTDSGARVSLGAAARP